MRFAFGVLFSVALATAALAKPRDVILTTDCGTEMDDQWAIVYLMLSPQVNVQGIVTTHAPNLAEPRSTTSANCARDVLRRLGLSSPPPVFAGSAVPLRSREPLRNAGVDFILETSKQYSSSNRLTILTIGATTDVGSAFLQDPALADRAEVLTMGFNSWPKGTDPWNIRNDPLAYSIILDSGVPLTIGSADVCRAHLKLDSKTVQEQFASHGELGAWMAGLFQDWITEHAEFVNRDVGPQQWVVWDTIVVAHLLGYTEAATYARPALNTADLTFTFLSRGQKITWITTLDERRMWADLIAKIDLHNSRLQQITPDKQPSPATYRVIIDSDAKNEIDDQYAIVYALKNPSLVVLGINATQFAQPDSVEQSYEEIATILQLMGVAGKIPVLRGAESPLADNRTARPSEAVQFVINQARASPEKLYVIAHGALTNIASAYLLAPEIADRIELYWLGGSFWPAGGREVNAENDTHALQVIMGSRLPFYLIPAHGVGGLLGLSYFEANRRLRHTEPVGDFLANRFEQIGDASRAIWDLSVPALLVHPEWGKQIQAPAPRVLDDLRYVPDPGGRTISVFTDLDPQKIFADFFSRFPPPSTTEPMEVLGASCVGNPGQVLVEFSNPLDNGAENRDNYTIAGVTIQGAHRIAENKVLLTTTPHEAGRRYTLRVENIRDNAKTPGQVPRGSSVSYTYYPSFDRGLECRFYTFDEALFHFPDVATRRPDRIESFPIIWFSYSKGKLQRTDLEDNFLMRCSGYVEISAPAQYTFWVESAGGVRFWLGKDLVFEKRPQSALTAMTAKIELERGVHRLILEYLPNHRSHSLLLSWFPPHRHASPIPETHLFHDVTDLSVRPW